MPDHFVPENQQHLQDAIAWALAHEEPLQVIGTGSRAMIGNPSSARRQLSMRNFCGITLYEPEELILQTHAATPMQVILHTLDDAGQCLPFDPPDYSAVLGSDNEQTAGTIGGLIGCGLAGSRRVKYGAIRDYVLGFQAVSGRAEWFKSGGRVVKNVTGYDLSKIFTGHWGTLGVVSNFTIKTGPKPHISTTILAPATLNQAQALMTKALRCPHDVCAAAWLPKSCARVCHLAHEAVCILRLEGTEISVRTRASELQDILHAEFPDMIFDSLHDDYHSWEAVKNLTPFVGTKSRLWRIATQATKAAQLLQDAIAGLQNLGHDVPHGFLDWGGVLT
ncbi:MAG: FAD-binding protein, partial [Pseudomonadota bacterium]